MNECTIAFVYCVEWKKKRHAGPSPFTMAHSVESVSLGGKLGWGLLSAPSLTSQTARFPGSRAQSSKPCHLTLTASSRPVSRPPTRAAPQWFSPPPFRPSKIGPLSARRGGEAEVRRRDPSGAFRREAPIGRECGRPPVIGPLGTPTPPRYRRPREKPGRVSRGSNWARGVAAAQVSVPGRRRPPGHGAVAAGWGWPRRDPKDGPPPRWPGPPVHPCPLHPGRSLLVVGSDPSRTPAQKLARGDTETTRPV